MRSGTESEIRARVPIRDESDVVVARRWVRRLAAEQGLAENAAESLALAVTEVARNIIVHATSGELRLGVLAEPARRGVMVIAEDSGPGIPDLERAMQDGFTTQGGLGYGLPGAQRLVDDFEIVSTIGAGTTITLRKWVPIP